MLSRQVSTLAYPKGASDGFNLPTAVNVTVVGQSVQGRTETTNIGVTRVLELVVGVVTRDHLKSHLLGSRDVETLEDTAQGLQDTAHYRFIFSK